MDLGHLQLAPTRELVLERGVEPGRAEQLPQRPSDRDDDHQQLDDVGEHGEERPERRAGQASRAVGEEPVAPFGGSAAGVDRELRRAGTERALVPEQVLDHGRRRRVRLQSLEQPSGRRVVAAGDGGHHAHAPRERRAVQRVQHPERERRRPDAAAREAEREIVPAAGPGLPIPRLLLVLVVSPPVGGPQQQHRHRQEQQRPLDRRQGGHGGGGSLRPDRQPLGGRVRVVQQQDVLEQVAARRDRGSPARGDVEDRQAGIEMPLRADLAGGHGQHDAVGDGECHVPVQRPPEDRLGDVAGRFAGELEVEMGAAGAEAFVDPQDRRDREQQQARHTERDPQQGSRPSQNALGRLLHSTPAARRDMARHFAVKR